MRKSFVDLINSRVEQPSASYRSLRVRYADRFVNISAKSNTSPASLFESIAVAFQKYWRKVLLEEISSDEGSAFLFSQLLPLSGEDFESLEYTDDKLTEISERLRENLRDQGIFSLWGRVLPHYEFMAWKSEYEERAAVLLPGGESVHVDVTYLDDFISLGWTGFATFDKFHNGGWATKDRLFCVRPYYDLTSERFHVSYLGHEARHFSDYKLFPSLQQADLEYRAKLTELALADGTLINLADSFRNNALNEPSSPHAFAAYHLVNRLESKLAALDERPDDAATKAELRTAAAALLDEHSRSLHSKGAEKVKTALQ